MLTDQDKEWLSEQFLRIERRLAWLKTAYDGIYGCFDSFLKTHQSETAAQIRRVLHSSRPRDLASGK